MGKMPIKKGYINGYCGSWWCKNPVRQVRKIDKVLVCRACYQYVWDQAQKTSEPIWKVFRKVAPPQRTPALKRTRCARRGCSIVLAPVPDVKQRRWIGRQHPVCRNCYEAVWEYQRKHNLSSMENALGRIPPKRLGKRGPLPSHPLHY